MNKKDKIKQYYIKKYIKNKIDKITTPTRSVSFDLECDIK
jgi:hypothetical protein